jgi:arsenate reductase-like glutaredoxin family protein
VEAWLSHNQVPFTMRDVMQDPLTPDEFAWLLTDASGRTRVPFTRVGGAAVLGFDPIRLRENIESQPPGAPVVAHIRPGEESSEALVAHLRAEDIPHAVRDVDEEPLSAEELWGLLTIPGRNVRTPYTLVGDDLVFGYDIPKLSRLLGIVP